MLIFAGCFKYASILQDDLANFEVNDPFVQQLIAAVEGLLTDIKVSALALEKRRVYSGI